MNSAAPWFEWLLSNWLSIPLVIALQITLIAGFTWLATTWVRSAAMQHRLWLTSFALNLSLLPIHLLIGGWPLSISSSAEIAQSPQMHSETTIGTLRAMPGKEVEESSQTQSEAMRESENEGESVIERTNAGETGATTSALGLRNETESSELRVGREWPWVICILLPIYTTITTALLLRFLTAVRVIERIVNAAEEVSASTLQLAHSIAAQLGMQQLPAIRIFRNGWPTVTGIRHTVMLPEDFDEWPVVQQRAALAHELSHVLRRDLWGELLASVACCFYWFHPLSWWMRLRLQDASERATDVAALAAGLSPQEYAQAVLEVLKHQREIRQLSPALPMTVAKHMGRRLNYVLTADLERLNTISWSRFSHFCMGAMIAITLLSSVRLVTATQPPAPLRQSSGETPSPVVTSPVAQTKTHEVRPEDNDLWVRMRDCEIIPPPAEMAGATASLSGRAVDAAGRPVADAIVVLSESIQYANIIDDMTIYSGLPNGHWKRAPDILARTRTDADGQFRLENITLRHHPATSKWQGDVLVMHPQAGFDWVSLSSPHHAKLESADLYLELAPLADISGIVVDAQQKPVANAEVRIKELRLAPKQPRSANFNLRLPHSQLTVSTHTDATGKFLLKNLPRECVICVLAEHPDYLPAGDFFTAEKENVNLEEPVYSDDPFQPGDNDPFSNPGNLQPVQISPGKIQLQTGVVLTGQVVDEHSRQPVPDNNLYLDGFFIPYRTDASGRFRIRTKPILPAGSNGSSLRTLKVVPANNSVYIARTIDLLSPFVKPDQALTVELSRGAWIEGKVVTKEGQSIPKATVRIWDHREMFDTFRAVTDSAGVYKLLAPRGKHKLVVGSDEPGYRMAKLDSILNGSAEGAAIDEWPQELADTSQGKDVKLPDIVVERSEPVECLVIYEDGTPAVGATVAIVEGPSGFQRRVSETKTTDDQGRATLLTCPLSNQSLAMARLKLQDVEYRSNGTPAKQRDAKGFIQIVLIQPALVHGRVLSNGQPVTGAIVAISSQVRARGLVKTEATTDETGQFRKYVPVGELSLSIQHMPQFNRPLVGSKGIPLAASGNYEAGDLEVNLPLKELAGQLVDQNGQPIVGALVQPQPLNPNSPFMPVAGQQVTTDSSGNFRFAGLLAGEYDLNIKLSKNKPFNLANKRITAGVRATVKVDLTK